MISLRSRLAILPAAALAAVLAFGGSWSDATTVTAAAAHPTVIELYQSQGCSSCPPANALLNRLTNRADLLPLSFAVTYWDSLGWKDTFASPAYTQRQWDFAHAGGRGSVATPQFVVNGRVAVSGSDPRELVAAIHANSRGDSGPSISVNGNRVTVGPGNVVQPATIWLVRYDPRERLVNIGRGENSGRALPHRNIVTGLRAVGEWTGKPLSFDQPVYRDPQERSAVLVEQGRGGPIIAAERI